MSRLTDQLHRVLEDCAQVLKKVTTGPPDKPRHVARLDLAHEHIKAWSPSVPPSQAAMNALFQRAVGGDNAGRTGGSSSPREVEDRLEASGLARQTLCDEARLKEICREMGTIAAVLRYGCGRAEALGDELYLLVARNTEKIAPAKLPDGADVPGCRSHNRREGVGAKQIGGHFEPAMPAKDEGAVRGNAEAARVGLCRWCYDHAKARADEQGLDLADPSCWPPLKAVHLHYTEGPRKAGAWLARRSAA